MLQKYREVFPLTIGNDPPVDAEPMKVVLKADATLVIATTRLYSATERLLRRALESWNSTVSQSQTTAPLGPLHRY